jgi:hypothetical protein
MSGRYQMSGAEMILANASRSKVRYRGLKVQKDILWLKLRAAGWLLWTTSPAQSWRESITSRKANLTIAQFEIDWIHTCSMNSH